MFSSKTKPWLETTSVAFQIFLFHLQRPVSARLLLVWMFSMCFIYNSVYFSPQESATLEPKCTVKVDEYGFFINWQSAERVSSSSLYKKVVRSWCIVYQLVSSFINVTKKSSKLKKNPSTSDTSMSFWCSYKGG